MAGMLSNSVSGLRAIQRALDTTSHNISNANTEGYSRQTAVISSSVPEFDGVGYVGSGSYVETVRREFDGLVERQLRSAISESARYKSQQTLTEQVNQIVGDLDAGIGQTMQGVFSAAQDVASNPSDMTARSSYLGAIETTVNQFNRVDQQLNDLQFQLEQQGAQMAREVDRWAQEVAELNEIISEAYQTNRNALPNDLMDRRDTLIRNIAERVDVKTLDSRDGNINLYLSSGQGLVINDIAQRFTAESSNANRLTVRLAGTDVTDRISGGSIGGILESQDRVIGSLRNELGRSAMVLATMINRSQDNGFKYDSAAPGEAFLAASTGTPNQTGLAGEPFEGNAISRVGNEGDAKVEFSVDEAYELTGDTYELRFDGTNWTAYASSSPNTAIDISADPSAIPGLTLSFPSGTAQAGDTYDLRPGEGVAGRLRLTDEAREPTNVAASAAADQPRNNENINQLIENGRRSIKDIVEIGYTNNSNVGKSLGDVVNGAVGNVGTYASQVRMRAESAETNLTYFTNRRESLSGVNLDEEAANLLKFQQAYQALARTISVQDRVFQSLLGAMG
ncbi:MAG: flagellar hook-associated protein FlgK [Halothiobacillaceae bacterium]